MKSTNLNLIKTTEQNISPFSEGHDVLHPKYGACKIEKLKRGVATLSVLGKGNGRIRLIVKNVPLNELE